METGNDQINSRIRDLFTKAGMDRKLFMSVHDEVAQKINEKGCYFYGMKSIPFLLRPFFLTPSQSEMISFHTTNLMKALETFVDLFFHEPECRPLFEVKTNYEELMLQECKLSKRLWFSRNDALLLNDDIKFIETNCDTPGGLVFADVLAELYIQSQLLKSIQKEWRLDYRPLMPGLLETLLTAYREFCSTSGKVPEPKPFIGVIASRQSVHFPEFELIAEWFNSKGYPSIHQDPRDLQCNSKNEVITQDGQKIDIIYRRGWLPDWADHPDETRDLMRAFKASSVCIVNPPSSFLAANKHILGLLKESRFRRLFSPDQLITIDQCIPWTKLMTQTRTEDWEGRKIDLYDFVRRNRDELVLKPLDQLGGKEVCVGYDSDQKSWEERIEMSTRNKYVVQRYIPIPRMEYPDLGDELNWIPQKTILNLFAHNHSYKGGFALAGKNLNVNLIRDGAVTPILQIFQPEQTDG